MSSYVNTGRGLSKLLISLKKISSTVIEDCSEGSENARVIDFSNFKLVPVNDTHTYTNGSWKFLRPLQSPWHGSLKTEKYIRGEWLMQALSRQYADICESFHNPLEPFYDFTKDMDGCPAEKGVGLNFLMDLFLKYFVLNFTLVRMDF